MPKGLATGCGKDPVEAIPVSLWKLLLKLRHNGLVKGTELESKSKFIHFPQDGMDEMGARVTESSRVDILIMPLYRTPGEAFSSEREDSACRSKHMQYC